MNRPTKVREIYKELRQALADDISAGEALQTAALLVELYEPTALRVGPGVREQRPTFDELPLDEVWSDGGWRVLSNETSFCDPDFGSGRLDPHERIQLKDFGVGMAA